MLSLLSLQSLSRPQLEHSEPHFSFQGIQVNEQLLNKVTPNEEEAKQLEELCAAAEEVIEMLKQGERDEKQAQEESEQKLSNQDKQIETLTRQLKDAGLAIYKLRCENEQLTKRLGAQSNNIDSKKNGTEKLILNEAIKAMKRKDGEIEVHKMVKIHIYSYQETENLIYKPGLVPKRV